MKTTRPIHDGPRDPIITPRLILRPYNQANDIRDLHDLRRRPEVTKHLKSRAPDVDEAATAKWAEKFLPENYHRFYGFVIESREQPGRVIGTTAVHNYDQAEIGYGLHPDFWGKGYATEAVVAILKSWWQLPRREYEMDGEHKLKDDGLVEESVMGYCDAANEPSSRVMVRAGFLFKGSIEEDLASGQVAERIYEMRRPQL